MYKQYKYPNGQIADAIIRLSDNASIPFNTDNRDAEEFGLWLKSGNVPEPAEEGGTVTPEWIAETIVKLS